MTHPSFRYNFSYVNADRYRKQMQENRSLTDFEEANTPEVTGQEFATPGEPASDVAIPPNNGFTRRDYRRKHK